MKIDIFCPCCDGDGKYARTTDSEEVVCECCGGSGHSSVELVERGRMGYPTYIGKYVFTNDKEETLEEAENLYNRKLMSKASFHQIVDATREAL